MRGRLCWHLDLRRSSTARFFLPTKPRASGTSHQAWYGLLRRRMGKIALTDLEVCTSVRAILPMRSAHIVPWRVGKIAPALCPTPTIVPAILHLHPYRPGGTPPMAPAILQA